MTWCVTYARLVAEENSCLVGDMWTKEISRTDFVIDAMTVEMSLIMGAGIILEISA